MAKLNKEEKEILESFKRGEWQSIPNRKKELKCYQQYAKATLKQDKRVNVRLSAKDLEVIQKRALEEGIPYQTLITRVLRQYADGRLTEKKT